jgi:ABC-type Zn uptake system ZnuABC Zn-binding protein ZnuA
MPFTRRSMFRTVAAGVPISLMPRTPARATDRSQLNIAVSTPLIADIVRQIAGERAQVFAVMPESADPHTWEASPQDMIAATEATTFISVGAFLEPFVEAGGWRRAMRDGGIPELVLADHLDLIVVDMVVDHGDHVHDLRGGDPHFWLDPRKVIDAVPVIRDHLAGLDPDGTDAYTAAAMAYVEALEGLDTELEHDLAAIPLGNRKLIVFHDAYRYFAARYDFEVAGVVMLNPEVEPSARELADLIDTVDDTGIHVIFAEPQFNTDVLEVVIDEHGIEVGELLTDSFAGVVDSYTDLMRFNRDSLVEHLGVG